MFPVPMSWVKVWRNVLVVPSPEKEAADFWTLKFVRMTGGVEDAEEGAEDVELDWVWVCDGDDIPLVEALP
jgi:hypothetical protein